MSCRCDGVSRFGWLALVLMLASCKAERVVPSVPAWAVASTPRLEVGDREDGDTAIFLTVTDARWHASGRLAVADAGAFGMRVYDATGALVARGGRRGRGPTEFNGRMALVDAAGDSVGIWDSGLTRWTMFNVVDGGMRAVSGDLGQSAWMQAGILVYSALDTPPAWLPRLLSGLSESMPDARVAHLDRDGLLVVNEDAARSRWLVFRDSAAPIASITLPANLALTHVATDAVVGIMTDSLGLQRVAVYTLSRGEHEPADLTPAVPPAVEANARSGLMAMLRNAVTAQEMNYAMKGSYTSSADSLLGGGQVPVPPNARFNVLEANDRGWSGVAWYPASGFTCGMVIGLHNPPGWREGEVNCGWQGRATQP